jgi:hypothetical protein
MTNAQILKLYKLSFQWREVCEEVNTARNKTLRDAALSRKNRLAIKIVKVYEASETVK